MLLTVGIKAIYASKMTDIFAILSAASYSYENIIKASKASTSIGK